MACWLGSRKVNADLAAMDVNPFAAVTWQPGGGKVAWCTKDGTLTVASSSSYAVERAILLPADLEDLPLHGAPLSLTTSLRPPAPSLMRW